jgi:hypothetical protein
VNYISDSRNLLRVKDNVKRQKLLYQGKMAVVTGLSKLPKTQHDPLSFTVDVTLFTVSLSVSLIYCIMIFLCSVHILSGRCDDY